MKISLKLLIFTLVLTLLTAAPVFAAASIQNIETAIMLNGKKITPGAPIKVRDGNTMVPLKAFIQQLGLALVWNTEYKGYRINSYHKALLLMPDSKLTSVVDVNSSNFRMDDSNTYYEFVSKQTRMPVPLTNQGGIVYISLKWISSQLGLTISSQSGVIHLTGEVLPSSQQHLNEVYQAIFKKTGHDMFLDSFESFLTYEYNSGIDREFITLENKAITSLMGKTIWLNGKQNVADFKTNVGITLSRFSEVKIVDEYTPYESLIIYKNKTYKINNSFVDEYFTKDPQKTFKWSTRAWDAIKNEKVFIGMNKTQAYLAWGEPDDINTSTSSSGEFEQWVYGHSSYLYFSNGLLTSIQN